MPHRFFPPPDRTPQARLAEAGMHGIVGYQLAQAAIVTSQVFRDRVGELGLGQVEFTVLALVHGNPDVSARQLARALAVTPPNVAAFVERLASRGLIERIRSESDGRVQHLRATQEGAALVERSVQQLVEGEQAALSTLTPAERAMLVELLHKVALARRKGEP